MRLSTPFLRLQAVVNRLLPEGGVAQSDGGIHSDVFQKQRQHVEPLLVRPEHLAFDQFDLLWAEVVVLLLNLGTTPLATLTLNVEFHYWASPLAMDFAQGPMVSPTASSHALNI